MRERIRTISHELRRKLGRLRDVLRKVMPRVAMAAALFFAFWLIVRQTNFYRTNGAGSLLGFLTFVLVCFTLIYYLARALRWLKRRVLWRVRRRLVITYLFVGLTPIVLLSLLGVLSAFGGSSQAMARLVTAQFNVTHRQAEENARALVNDFQRLPANTTDRDIQSWLDERDALLQISLPGARLALWRGAAGEDPTANGHSGPAQFVSEHVDENTRGVGNEQATTGAPLPAWLRGRESWSGLAYTANENEIFASTSVRALSRGTIEARPFTLLLVVPINRALVQQYRDNTGLYIRPYFPGIRNFRRSQGALKIESREGNGNQRRTQANGDAELERRVETALNVDQFGEPLDKGLKYLVLLPSTNWANGEARENLSFLFDWSWGMAVKQFLGGSGAGEAWKQSLKVVSIVFLVLELLALLAAAWMTRAVTGTVHKLYRATEFIKRGDFSHRVRVRSQDQLGELAESFNDMAANVESLLQERVMRERLEREVEIAAEVQAQLFPRSVPALLSVAISAECRAARGVAGDYYDYIEVAPGLVALALGDVSGKGISASLVMSNLQASLRAQTTITAERLSIAERAVAASAGGGGSLLAHVVADADMDGAVSRMTSNINEQLCQSTDSNRFATLFLAIYEDGTRTLRYTNAGHNAAVLVGADGGVEMLVRGGVMVGAFDWARYEESSVRLREGDLLLIFSDGISEAENGEGEEYGEERLLQFVIRQRRLTADGLRHAIFEEIDRWSGTRERNDDQTIMIMKAGT